MNKKNIKNKTNTKFFNHLHKVKRRHVEKFLHTRIYTHHTMIHIGEVLVIGMLGFSSLLFANYNNSYIHLHRSSVQEIKQSLINAIEQKKPDLSKSKIISVWEMDGKVNNTFAQGYCTYGAARISPEFFPYSEDKMSQQRTRGGNAIDRCENAKEAGFKIGNTPSVGSLIVYSRVGSNTQFGHVGKVMFYNKQYQSLIIRDMNRLGLYIMTDRWEDATNKNIKCYIYPQVQGNNQEKNKNKETTDKFDIENKNEETTEFKTSDEEKIQDNTHNAATEEDTTEETTLNDNQENIEEITQEENIEESIIDNNKEEKIIYEEEKDIINEEENKGSIKININDTMNISDITKHFLSIYDIEIVIVGDKDFKVNNNMLLKVNIINKQNNQNYEGILPFMINIITQNNIIESNISTLQLSNNKGNVIKITSKEKGSSNIILTIDNEKVATIPVIIN